MKANGFALPLAQPIPGLRLPNGEVTPGKRWAGSLRLRNARVSCAFRLAGKRVLNLGCGHGLHSFYMAASAGEVIGIDHSAKRIATAEATRMALGTPNVRFVCGDIRDPDLVAGLPRFDLVIAWGFLHRISDIFSLLHTVSPLTDALSLEWSTPVFPFMSRAALAYHSTADRALNARNVRAYTDGADGIGEEDGCSDDGSSDDGPGQGNAGFWRPTPGAVRAICRRFGYAHARILGYGENFDSGAATVVRQWAVNALHAVRGRPREQFPLARVHLLAEKSPGTIEMTDPLGKDVRFPAWDVALNARAGAKRVA